MSPDCGGVTSGTRASFPTDIPSGEHCRHLFESSSQGSTPPHLESTRTTVPLDHRQPPTAKGVTAREVSVWCPKNRTRRCRYACR